MNYTKATYFYDFNNPVIQEIIEPFRDLLTEQEKIKQLYLRIRDGWRYNAYSIGSTPNHYTASYIATKVNAHCIDKAVLLVTCLRALDIPARIRLAKVSNHIAAERLIEIMGTNELTPHGLAEVFHNDKWVKCSPTFNRELCERYNVAPLEFDGTEDSILQEYNNDDKKFMEYLEDYGHFEDLPLAFIANKFKEYYPQLYAVKMGTGELAI